MDAAGGGGAAYDYHYEYGLGGNLNARVNELANPPITRDYDYGTAADHHAHAVTGISGGLTAAFGYDNNGNMTTRTVGGVTYTQAFDVENRLTSVTVNGQMTAFYYDADGNRILAVLPNQTKVYTPYPDYEESVTSGGAVTERATYRLAGQIIAVRVRTDPTNSGAVTYAYSDHLGSIVIWLEKNAAGNWVVVANSLARYEPFGGYRTKPAASVNPAISDRGFTGHRQNNTGANDLGLIYMNARYYLPEVGRFISADTIVPDPSNPQSFNRYGYTLNNPVNFTDPTGHMESNGCERGESCQPLANPWQLTESLLDKDQNGVVPDREISREMDRLESSSATTLLAGAVPPVDSSLNPFGGPMTSTNCDVVGRPPCDARHPAVDSRTDATNRYDPVYATAPGKVVAIGYATDGFGNYVVIEHNVYGTLYYSVYAHNAQVYVAVGDIVIAGTAIASMGDTDAQAIVHSHFEIRTPNNLSLAQSNPFTGHVYWPTTASSLAANFVNLGPMYGYADTYNTWAEANP